jgi:hypothetical protein
VVLYPVSATYGIHSKEHVRKGAEKLQKFLHSKQQGRLDGFFTVKAKEPAAPKAKGKAEDKKGKAGAKSRKRVKRKVEAVTTWYGLLTLCKPDTSDRPYYFLSTYLI